MSGIWGNKIQVSIFGESHGTAIGITIHGLPSGILLNLDQIYEEMSRRAPGRSKISSSRCETDYPEIISGFFQGRTTGAPLCCIIRNDDHRSKDYEKYKTCMRPGHSDYPASVRYEGFQDYRGGGHFSGRITAPLVFAGAICKQLLAARQIYVGAHIQKIGAVEDRKLQIEHCHAKQLREFQRHQIPLLDGEKREEMLHSIELAAAHKNSLGGVVECAAIGIPAGIGEPFFDSVESTLSHLLFSVPAVKGVEFGDGFAMASMTGAECNDAYYYEGDQIHTQTNHNGGILGGLTNGMPLVFRVAIKPTPSIGLEQQTVNIADKCDTVLTILGRHDPCIVPRAVPVVEAACALALCQWI